jgi:Holliday junction resolvase
MSKMSRDKGARGEREVADLIKDASGGVFAAQRGCQHAGRFAVGVASPDVLTDLPLHLEVKRTEKPAVKAAWAQALADAGIEKEPCVAMRWNGGEWLGLVRLSHLVAALAEISRLKTTLLQLEKRLKEIADSTA